MAGGRGWTDDSGHLHTASNFCRARGRDPWGTWNDCDQVVFLPTACRLSVGAGLITKKYVFVAYFFIEEHPTFFFETFLAFRVLESNLDSDGCDG